MMDASSAFFWPAFMFTLLAVVVAGVVVLGRNTTHASSKSTFNIRETADKKTVNDEDDDCDDDDDDEQQHCEKIRQMQSRTKHESRAYVEDADNLREEEDSSTGWEEEECGIRNALRDYSHSSDAESKPLRYMAGMLRTCQMEKMMSKEELEEEQRVQREQLAAIFQLLKDKEDTFGEVTESDLQEQLKLYSI